MLVTPHNKFTGEHFHTGKPLETKGLYYVNPVSDFCRFNHELQSKRIPLQFGDLNRRDEPTEPFFVDWLTIKQTFDFEIPVINAGVFFSVDANGEVEWQTQRSSQIQGSYDTTIQLRSDGHTLSFSGNVSRFGRTNNLFGYSFGDCLRRINNILSRFALPPFTGGQKFYRNVRHEDGTYSQKLAYTGASISRIDLTKNYETGSLSNARAYLEFLATQQGNARLKVATSSDGETVHWGAGSRRLYSKVYIKSTEMRKHDMPMDLIEYCEEVGIVRFEITAKATQLQDMGCNYLGGFDMKQLEILFNERASLLTRAEHTVDDLETLPNAFRRTARDYLAGDDLTSHLSVSTFRRHRLALLPFGIDISVRRNVIDFKPRVRVIELKPASVPSWYQLDERLAA
jgi:Phage replication protein CRI/Phage X family